MGFMDLFRRPNKNLPELTGNVTQGGVWLLKTDVVWEQEHKCTPPKPLYWGAGEGSVWKCLACDKEWTVRRDPVHGGDQLYWEVSRYPWQG